MLIQCTVSVYWTAGAWKRMLAMQLLDMTVTQSVLFSTHTRIIPILTVNTGITVWYFSNNHVSNPVRSHQKRRGYAGWSRELENTRAIVFWSLSEEKLRTVNQFNLDSSREGGMQRVFALTLCVYSLCVYSLCVYSLCVYSLCVYSRSLALVVNVHTQSGWAQRWAMERVLVAFP